METAKSDCIAGSALTKQVQTAHAQLEPWPKRPPGGQSSSGCNLYRKRILHIRSRKRSCRNKIRQRLEDLLFRIVSDSKILPNHDASVGVPRRQQTGEDMPGAQFSSVPWGAAALRMLCFTSNTDVSEHGLNKAILFFICRGNYLASFVKTCLQSN